MPAAQIPADITPAELIAYAAAMRRANRSAKAAAKAKRTKDAFAIAPAHTIQHTGKFPSRYKAG